MSAGYSLIKNFPPCSCLQKLRAVRIKPGSKHIPCGARLLNLKTTSFPARNWEKHTLQGSTSPVHKVQPDSPGLAIDLNYHVPDINRLSRHLTVFCTHVGLFWCERLNFDVSSAAKKFQDTIHTALFGLEGVFNISDHRPILIHGKDEADRNRNLEACLQRLQNKNLTLNEENCQFYKTCIESHGHVRPTLGGLYTYEQQVGQHACYGACRMYMADLINSILYQHYPQLPLFYKSIALKLVMRMLKQ